MSTPLGKPILNWDSGLVLAALKAAGLLVKTLGDKIFSVHSIVTDSRVAACGDVFVALRGERFDAHHFVLQVLKQGVSAVLVERALELDCTQWVVTDTRKALACLAAAWRGRFQLPVLAVTGSNGKTTTKEMVAAILRVYYGEHAVLATRGNLNNDIGVPHTLFELNSQHRVAVIEMGMNRPGEIANLAAIVRPTVALVNNAQREHQAFMETVAAVAQENGTVLSFLPDNGCAIYPAVDEYSNLWTILSAGRQRICFALKNELIKFSEEIQSSSTAVSAQISAEGMSVVLEGPWGVLAFKMQLLGQHNALNALSAACCAWVVGCDAGSIASALAAFEPVQGRMQSVKNSFGGVLIDDTYNANPDSVEAAIRTLACLPKPTYLVLGDMGEVGDQGEEFHKDLGFYARNQGIDCVLTLGDLAKQTAYTFGAGAVHFDHVEALLDYLVPTIIDRPNSILIKGSRFMRMERVVQVLVKESQNDGGVHAA